MLNYIKAECFKTFKRIYMRNTLLIFVLLAIAVNVLFFVAFRSSPTNSQELIRTSLSVIVPMLLIITGRDTGATGAEYAEYLMKTLSQDNLEEVFNSYQK